MVLDPRTLFVTALLLGLCLTLLVHRVARAFPTIAGPLVDWSGGTLLMVLGGVFLLLRDVVPDFASVVVGNVVFALGVVVTGRGVAAFNQRPFPTLTLGALLSALPFVLAYFTWVEPSFRVRTVVVNGLLLLSVVFGTWALARGRAGAPRRFADHFTTASGVVLCLALAFRVFEAVFVPEGANGLWDPGTASTLLFGASAVSTLVLPAGLLLIVTDRVAQEFERRSTHDFLTGALNRRGFAQVASAERARAGRRGTSLALLLLDLDRFKTVNDRHGHAAGDTLLAQFVARVARTLRAADHLSRHGGEEFLLLLPETDLAGARLAAERIRAALASAPFDVGGTAVHVTTSVGAAMWGESESLDDALHRADVALYRAKETGRDRVEVEA